MLCGRVVPRVRRLRLPMMKPSLRAGCGIIAYRPGGVLEPLAE